VHLDRRLFNWGLFFLALGLIALVVRAGYIAPATAARAWTLWPVLLICAGLAVLLRRTPIQFLAGGAAAVVLGWMLGGLLVTGRFPSVGCGPTSATTSFPTQQGSLGSSASVDIETNCGQLTVQSAPGGSWSVSGTTDRGLTPRITATTDRLEVRSPDRSDFGVLGSPDDVTVSLPQLAATDLTVNVNAGTGRLHLTGLQLRALDAEINAGGADIDLTGVETIGSAAMKLNAVGDARVVLPKTNLTGSLEANAAGDVRLCAPAGVGLHLPMQDNITASNNFAARGLTKVGDAWETPGYASAATRIDLTITANAARITLEPEGSCGAS